MSERIALNDQIRGVAMALRHWFEVKDLETVQSEAGILVTEKSKKGGDEELGKRTRFLRMLSFSSLPPQLVRLKPDAPMVTIHYMQDVYDDGDLRADPWRWWFAWVAVEMMARLGPDPNGKLVEEFIKTDASLETVRSHAPRWLASNPLRLLAVEHRLQELVHNIAEDNPSLGRRVEERVEVATTRLDLTLVDVMAKEAGTVSASISFRVEERAMRG